MTISTPEKEEYISVLPSQVPKMLQFLKQQGFNVLKYTPPEHSGYSGTTATVVIDKPIPFIYRFIEAWQKFNGSAATIAALLRQQRAERRG